MSKKKILGGIAEEVGKFAKAATDQVAGQSQDKSPSADAQDETREFVKSLYGTSETNKKPATTETQKQEEAQKSTEEEQKLAKLRQELHSRYYQNLINRPKPKEERPAEKVEREKKEDRWKLEEKKAKEKPIAVQRAAEKIEKYPGASG